MARIMIKCPKGKTVFTGMWSDPKRFESSEYFGNTFRCSDCNGVHTWNKAEAFLEEEQT